ncbi:DUF1353 domain-containing protein [Bradyrhizobium sp. 14AA]
MDSFDRRKFLTQSALLGGATFLSGPVLAAKPKRQPIPTPAEWMDKWINDARAVEGALYLGRFADPTYFITKPISWKPNPGQEQYKAVTVPVGFVTDFASIPRAFWSLLRPDGIYAYAAVIHDWLYWEQDRSKDTSDMTLKFAMQDFKIDAATINTIYAGVRAGGGSAWAGNKRLKASGEKRTLKRFPDDPTTRWDDWKKRPDVF